MAVVLFADIAQAEEQPMVDRAGVGYPEV